MFVPYVLADCWYGSLENLKNIKQKGWKWIAPLKKNRIVSTKPHLHEHIEKIEIPEMGIRVHLRDYGEIKVFKIASKDQGIGYFATNDCDLSPSDVERIYANRWKIEEYHRGLKQQCGISKCQARKGRYQRNHIWAAIHAFVALEAHRLKTDVSWQEAKRSIIRDSVRTYLLEPRFALSMSSSA